MAHPDWMCTEGPEVLTAKLQEMMPHVSPWYEPRFVALCVSYPHSFMVAANVDSLPLNLK